MQFSTHKINWEGEMSGLLFVALSVDGSLFTLFVGYEVDCVL